MLVRTGSPPQTSRSTLLAFRAITRASYAECPGFDITSAGLAVDIAMTVVDLRVPTVGVAERQRRRAHERSSLRAHVIQIRRENRRGRRRRIEDLGVELAIVAHVLRPIQIVYLCPSARAHVQNPQDGRPVLVAVTRAPRTENRF